jgi:hypothetical protein
MNESSNSQAIEMSRCPMRRCIVEMEESAPRRVLRLILRPLFGKIGQGFSNKELTLKYFMWEEQDQTHDSTTKETDRNHHVFRSDQPVGLVVSTPADMKNRGLSERTHVLSPVYTFANIVTGFHSMDIPLNEFILVVKNAKLQR